MSPVRFAKSLLVILLFCVPNWAQTPVVVYENSAQFEGVYANYLGEYGDEIILANTARYVTEIDFEYTADYAATNQAVDAIIRFYSNTIQMPGAHSDFKIPSALLWKTHFSVSPGDHQVKLKVPYIKVPDHFTWTVEFSGFSMLAGDRVGLRFYAAPSTGSSYNDFWELLAIGWFPARDPLVSTNNFACKVWAVESTPTLTVTSEGPNVRLSWPAVDSSFVVESKSAATGGVWAAVVGTPTQVGDTMQLVLAAGDSTQVFRLSTQPQGRLDVSVTGNMLHIKWPAVLGGQTLQGRALGDAQWHDLDTPSRPTGQYYDAAIPLDSDVKFFQLRKLY
jgi:hypothetical protein